MPALSPTQIQDFFATGDAAATTKAKGDALEDAICYVFGCVPGVWVSGRNKKNILRTEEIDIAFWNEQSADGFFFLPNIILVECKNWSGPVGSAEVSWFDTKLRNRGLSFGILVAASGIAGNPDQLHAAHSIISKAASEQRRIVVFSRQELLALQDTDGLVRAMKVKLCDLALVGTTA